MNDLDAMMRGMIGGMVIGLWFILIFVRPDGTRSEPVACYVVADSTTAPTPEQQEVEP